MSIFNNYEGLTEKYVSFFKEFDDKIVVLTNNNEHHDFYLPSLFKTIIVSNSTFHWWSAFLNGKNSIATYIPSNFGILKPEMFLLNNFSLSKKNKITKKSGSKVICAIPGRSNISFISLEIVSTAKTLSVRNNR